MSVVKLTDEVFFFFLNQNRVCLKRTVRVLLTKNDRISVRGLCGDGGGQQPKDEQQPREFRRHGFRLRKRRGVQQANFVSKANPLRI